MQLSVETQRRRPHNCGALMYLSSISFLWLSGMPIAANGAQKPNMPPNVIPAPIMICTDVVVDRNDTHKINGVTAKPAMQISGMR